MRIAALVLIALECMAQTKGTLYLSTRTLDKDTCEKPIGTPARANLSGCAKSGRCDTLSLSIAETDEPIKQGLVIYSWISDSHVYVRRCNVSGEPIIAKPFPIQWKIMKVKKSPGMSAVVVIDK